MPARFFAIFTSSLLGFLSVGAVLPILPRYVKGPLESTDLAVGIVIGAFAIAAVVSRPLAGRAADARGRRAVVTWGALACAMGGALYFVPGAIPSLLVARLVLGVGEALIFTAGTAWVVDIAPEDRRGQIIGIFGLSIWTGLSAGPAIGEGLFALGGYDAVWAFTIVSPLLGALVARGIPDDHRPIAAPEGRRSLVPAAAIRPGGALALAAVGNAAVVSFIVLHLETRGGHGTLAFIFFAFAVVGSRLLASRLPDLFGARRMAVAAACVEAVGLAIIAVSGHWAVASVGAAFVGVGWALLFPSLALMVVTDAGERRRAEALGTYTAFFDIGFGIGAPLCGAVVALGGYPAAFWVGAGFAIVGGLVSAAGADRFRRAAPAET